MYIREYLQFYVGQTRNLYDLFDNNDARTDKPSSKSKLPVARYSYNIVSGDETSVELSRNAQGFYVKAVNEIKIPFPVVIEITIIGDEGNLYPVTRVKIVTDTLPKDSNQRTNGGGGGDGGGGGGGYSGDGALSGENSLENLSEKGGGTSIVGDGKIPTGRGTGLQADQFFTHLAYILGYEDGTVRPDGNITRAELAMILYRTNDDNEKATAAFDTDPFPDVKLKEWYGYAVSYMKKIGLMQGDPDGTFRPDDYLTRVEFAVVIARLRDINPALDIMFLFPDTEGHWGIGYVNAVNKEGFMLGYPDGTFRPDINISRAETVTAMNRLFVRKPDAKDIMDKTHNPYSDLSTDHWAYAQVMEASVTHDYSMNDYEIWKQ